MALLACMSDSDSFDKSLWEMALQDVSDSSDEDDSSSSNDEPVVKGKDRTKTRRIKPVVKEKDRARTRRIKDWLQSSKYRKKRIEDSLQSSKYRKKGIDPGYVLVIVNYKFDYEKKLPRGNDIEEIKKLFSEYGYKVRSGTNLNREEILRKVKRYCTKQNVGNFICFFSSHGDQTSLSCPNGNDIEINDIMRAANTRQLTRFPKVFFFDACRSKCSKKIREKSIPEPPNHNYYVGFSCLASTESKTGKTSCGVYFEEIVKVFKDGFRRPIRDSGIVRDLNHFMNKVHHNIRTEHEQIPTIRTTLTGKVFLQDQK